MLDPTKPQSPEPDALAVTRKLVQQIDADPKLQRAVQKVVRQMRQQSGSASAQRPIGK